MGIIHGHPQMAAYSVTANGLQTSHHRGQDLQTSIIQGHRKWAAYGFTRERAVITRKQAGKID